MGNKGNDRHVKRLASPRYQHVERKVNPYIIKPNAGRHTSATSIALATVLKEKLGVVGSTKEAKIVLGSGSVEVNGKVIRDFRYPLGFGDVLKFREGNEHYRIGVGRKGVVNIEKSTATSEQVFKVIGKYVSKGNKEMIRLYNGSVVQSAKGVKVNDSVKVKDGKVSAVIKLEKGASYLVIRGVHASEGGTISEIRPGTAVRPAIVEIDGKGGKKETLLDNVMAVGA